jgi:molecular chaperone GrpE
MVRKRAKSRNMKEDPSVDADSPADGQDDSIEILEVVGLDEKGGAASQKGDSPPEAPPAQEADSIPYSREQLYDMLRRKQADFENARKRMDREKEELHRRIWMDLLQRLLPVMDNFDRAMGGSPSQGQDPLRQGISLTLQQMMEILVREGLEEIPALGEHFDPHAHEAVETRAVEGLEEGIVIEVLRKGYRFRGQLLRPALVRVSSASAGGAPGGS